LVGCGALAYTRRQRRSVRARGRTWDMAVGAGLMSGGELATRGLIVGPWKAAPRPQADEDVRHGQQRPREGFGLGHRNSPFGSALPAPPAGPTLPRGLTHRWSRPLP